MHVLFCSAEVAPYATTGGLSSVSATLPAALRRLGVDARIVMPRYRHLRDGGAPLHGPLAGAFLPAAEAQEELRIYATTLAATPVYMLDIPAAFDRDELYGYPDDDRRFVLFARGVLALAQHLRAVEGWEPGLIHANDWHSGLVPNYVRTTYHHILGGVATVFTIHNLGYQGCFGTLALSLAGLTGHGLVERQVTPHLGEQFNFMVRGILYADMVSTVSPTYAREILTPAYGEQLDGLLRSRADRLTGILNGIDFGLENPAADPHIAARYWADEPAGKVLCKAALQRACGFAVDPSRPILAMVTRFIDQKGLDLVDAVLPWIMEQTDAQLVMIGSPHPRWEPVFTAHARAYPERVHLWLTFTPARSSQVFAGSDILLMPSRYEPSGLGQLVALRYGTVPLVRSTGGLNDSVREGPDGNGFCFRDYTPQQLRETLERCLAAYQEPAGWSRLRQRGMREDHSWDASAREYVRLYERALQAAHG